MSRKKSIGSKRRSGNRSREKQTLGGVFLQHSRGNRRTQRQRRHPVGHLRQHPYFNRRRTHCRNHSRRRSPFLQLKPARSQQLHRQAPLTMGLSDSLPTVPPPLVKDCASVPKRGKQAPTSMVFRQVRRIRPNTIVNREISCLIVHRGILKERLVKQ